MNNEDDMRDLVYDYCSPFAFGTSLVVCSLFLLSQPNYFSSLSVAYLIGGFLGLFGETVLDYAQMKLNEVRGSITIRLGMFLLLIWFITTRKISALWANIVFFVFLLLGLNMVVYGIYRAVYSIFVSDPRDKRVIVVQLLFFLLQLVAFGGVFFHAAHLFGVL